MKLRISIETVFEDGRTAQHRLGTWRRTAEHLHPEGIGLLLEDGHAMLAQIQKVAIEAQMEEISATCRVCPCCGKVRPIHDYRTRTLETLFGRLKVKAPRIKPCRCRECPRFCVWLIGSMLPERSKDDDDIQRTAGRVAEGLQAA